MDVPDQSGLTVRHQLTKIAEKTGVRPPALDEEPQLSATESQFIKLFWKIRRASGGSITISAINNWCDAYQHPLSPIELDYILELDSLVGQELSNTKDK